MPSAVQEHHKCALWRHIHIMINSTWFLIAILLLSLMIMNSAMSALNTLQLYSRLQSLSKRLPTTWLIIHIIHAFLAPGITRVQNIAAFNTWLVEAWLAGIQSILITKVTTSKVRFAKASDLPSWARAQSVFTSVSICQQKINNKTYLLNIAKGTTDPGVDSFTQ